MAVRPPRILAPRRQTTPVEDAIHQETMGEKAGTLGRLGERLRLALAALEAHDEAGREDPQRRAELVDAAATALWYVTIQRDLMGLPRNDRFLKEIGAPPEVVRRMGAVRPRRRSD
jgi:hypothetical protein